MEEDLKEIEINHNDTSLIMKDELKILIQNQSALNQNDIKSENEIELKEKEDHLKKPPDGGIRVRIYTTKGYCLILCKFQWLGHFLIFHIFI